MRERDTYCAVCGLPLRMYYEADPKARMCGNRRCAAFKLTEQAGKKLRDKLERDAEDAARDHSESEDM